MSTTSRFTVERAREVLDYATTGGTSDEVKGELAEHMAATGDCVMHAFYARGFGDGTCGCANCAPMDARITSRPGLSIALMIARLYDAQDRGDTLAAQRIGRAMWKVLSHWEGMALRNERIRQGATYERVTAPLRVALSGVVMPD